MTRDEAIEKCVRAMMKQQGYDDHNWQLRPIEKSLAEKPVSTETLVESDDVSAGAVAATPVSTDVDVGPGAGINPVADTVLGQQEIERRRNLARTLFNDFWSGVDEKPAAFVERLDQAEDYVNERLAASGEFWQLDAKTRAMLGLPPRSNSPNNGKNRATIG